MADKNNFLLNVKENYVIEIKKYNTLRICPFLYLTPCVVFDFWNTSTKEDEIMLSQLSQTEYH